MACEDGQQVEAHKAILASSSPFFKELLMKNKHPHPLVYMRALRSEDLVAMVDFLYFGEANVFQENLDSFLELAEELKLKGLTGTGNSGKHEEQTIETHPKHDQYQDNLKKTINKNRMFKNIETQGSTNFDRAVAVQDDSMNLEVEDLDAKIKSMMTITNMRSANGRGFLATCNICGKQSPSKDIPQHIESNHITGFSHPCNICGKTSRSRHALATHKNTYHKALLQD